MGEEVDRGQQGGDGGRDGRAHRPPQPGEQQAEDAVLHVGFTCLAYGRRRDEQFEKLRGPHERSSHEQSREENQKQGALSHDGSQGLVFTLAVASGHEYLSPGAESEGNHVEGQVKHTGQSRGSQLHLSHTAHEGGVGDVDEVLNKKADQDGERNSPYIFAAVHTWTE